MAAGLDEEVGRSDQVIGKVASGFVSVKFEVTILRIGVPLVDLDVTKFAAELHGVLAYDLGEVVEALKAVIELPGCPIRKAEGEPGRPKQAVRRNTLERRIGGEDAKAAALVAKVGHFAQSG